MKCINSPAQQTFQLVLFILFQLHLWFQRHTVTIVSTVKFRKFPKKIFKNYKNTYNSLHQLAESGVQLGHHLGVNGNMHWLGLIKKAFTVGYMVMVGNCIMIKGLETNLVSSLFVAFITLFFHC
jgi:hypothetical protein